jgi:hypothetical protein
MNVRRLRPATSRRAGIGDDLEPSEIFELIVKADEKLKYATAAKGDVRAGQARDLLEQAREAARAIGNEGLVGQAETRLSDLTTLQGEGDADADEPS